MRASLLWAAFLASFAIPSAAQNVQTYIYDANGRLIATTTANPASGAISNFALDSADNRTGTHASPTGYPTQVDRLASGEQLVLAQQLTSQDGRFSLRMQQDGNLVLWFGSTVLWQTSTGQGRSWYFRMETSGNAVLYNPSFIPLWTSNTTGNAGAYLMVQNDGNLVIRNSGGAAIWQSFTCCH